MVPDRTQPVTAAELAARIGLAIDTFYRTRARLHRDDGLPQPITATRPFRWDRATVDAWFGRHHPHAPRMTAQRPANDQAPTHVPGDAGEWTAYLARIYGMP